MQLLQNIEQDKFLEQQGYVVVPFLNTEEVKTLVDIFYENHPQNKEGLYATAHSDNYDFKKKLNDIILKTFGRALSQTFLNCRPLGGSYIVKYKGKRGVLYPHQDWNIVDEDYYRSFNIWVPLVDTNEKNGALAVLPQSHKLLKSYRGVNVPDPFYKVNAHTWNYHTTVAMKAGEALIYDHRLLHASAVNETEEPRLAVVFGIIPEKAEMRYYYLTNGIIEEYENSVDFFFKHDILKGPQGLKKFRDIGPLGEPLNQQQFETLYQQQQNANKPPVIKLAEPQPQKSLLKRWIEKIGL